MKRGDFVAVHFFDEGIGTQVGRFVSDDGDTVSVQLGTVNGDIIMKEIPKQFVTLYLSV